VKQRVFPSFIADIALQDVGSRAMGSLIAVLQHDAPFDTDIAKAALETLMQLCETAEKVSCGL
jgi:cytochrome c556